MCLLRLTLGASIAAFLAGCSGNLSSPGSFLPNADTQPPTIHRHATSAATGPRQGSVTGYVYVTNQTAQGTSQLLVYPAGVPNPSPSHTITQAGAMGVAVDTSGNVYVANGSGGNVLEYQPGGGPLVQTYSAGLTYPVGVAVSNTKLYVADRGNAANGNIQQVMEYNIGTPSPAAMQMGGPGFAPQLNAAIAVNPLGSSGTFYASATTVPIPFTGTCPPNGSYLVAEEHNPILWQTISPLSANGQVSGLAFDSSGNMYAADPCANNVAIYSNVNGAWTYSKNVGGTFAAPLLLTINSQLLAVPSSGNGSNTGYVTIVDLSGKTSAVKITKGLTHPIGAVVGGS